MAANNSTDKAITLTHSRSLGKKSASNTVIDVIESATNQALAEATSGKEKLAAVNSSLTAILKLDKAQKLGRA